MFTTNNGNLLNFLGTSQVNLDNDRISFALGDLLFIPQSNYFNLTNFKPKFHNNQQPKFYIMLHLNIRSLNKNYDDFCDFIAMLPTTTRSNVLV